MTLLSDLPPLDSYMSLLKRNIDLLVAAMWHDNRFFLLMVSILLLPLTALYWLISFYLQVRKVQQRQPSLVSAQLELPVIIVGNISVGGTGKTPILINLAKQLSDAGYRPAIISRGYGGIATTNKNKVVSVRPDSDPQFCGEEPVLIAQSLMNIPVIVSAQRVLAFNYVANNTPSNVVLSDDGLQHYQLPRSIEIAVIDTAKGLGNRLLLPSGPLREPFSRLHSVDHIVLNGPPNDKVHAQMKILSDKTTSTLINIKAMRECQPCGTISHYSSIADICNKLNQFHSLHMLAGIGNPSKFFTTVNSVFGDVDKKPILIPYAYSDHHRYTIEDVQSLDDIPSKEALIMTAKDAVKLQSLANRLSKCYFIIDIETVLDDDVTLAIIERLNKNK